MQKKRSTYDVLGIGCPVIDQVLAVGDDFLEHVPGAKGGMVLVDYKTLSSIIQRSNIPPLILPGGSSANTIRGLARLGHKCAFVGKIGKDDMGKRFIDSLQDLDITPLLIYTHTPTAQALCLITPDSERTLRTFLGAGTEMTHDDLQPDFFSDVKHVHIEGYTLYNGQLTERAMVLAKEAGAKVSFDLGSFEVVSHFKEEIIRLVSRYVDVLFGNRDEMQQLTQLAPDKAIDVLRDLCETSIVLMGGDGCLVARGIQKVHCPALAVDVVDTTGAGDLFISGFLHGYLQGHSLEESARYGILTGAHVVQVQGVDIPIHAWENILQQIKQKN